MGRNVARNNSPDEPGKHSRLWSSKNIGDVLKKNKGTETIEERLPLGFHPEKLVILELPFSEIKNLWGLNVVFENLKTLDMSNASFFQTFSGFGHKIIIFTDELPDWISPSDNLEESSTVSLDLLPNVSHNFSVMQETSACTEEFLDCISESWYLEESTVPLDLLPNISQDFLQMYEINTDREEFLDCISESFNLEDSVVSLSLLPNGSRDSLEMHETNTDTEEFPDWISESCYSEEPIVLSIDFLSHNIWGLHETKTYPEEFPDDITESSYLPMLQSKMFSNLLPNASHNFLGMILCFMPGTSPIMYAVKSNTSDVMYSSEDFDCFHEIVMIIVPRSIFAIRDGDDRIELTSDKEIILGIYPLYKPENNLERCVGDLGPNFFFHKRSCLQSFVLRFLNKAAIILDGDVKADGSKANPWTLCSVQQIEEVKYVGCMFLLVSSHV
ncbi:hypothetical protein POM88_019913 [Heracleum sosnowskyi]|uniref:Uncharacterized protein n=1 Tax=Heracleum sosnowskyi TaxID=360622 RepID=A0AAD8IBK1_9APIA|nr:hypothetical protein POM88_019913 [Heracleum sosnowskyi]